MMAIPKEVRTLALGLILVCLAGGGVHADRVVLRSGKTVEGLVRDQGLRIEVQTGAETLRIPRSDIERIVWDRPESWLKRPPEWPETPRSVPDLDVTLIEVLPRKQRPGRQRRPGERLTFVAHVVNRGTAAGRDIPYEFRMGPRVESRGILRRIRPGQRLTFSLIRPFDPRAATVSFEVESPLTRRKEEISFANNRREVSILSPTLLIGADRDTWAAFQAVRNMTGSFSLEDYLEEHVRQLNLLLRSGKGGSSLRPLRIDRFADVPRREELQRLSTLPGQEDGGSLYDGMLFLSLRPAAASTEALPVRWDLVARLAESLGLPCLDPFFPEDGVRPPSCRGFPSESAPERLSPFAESALKRWGWPLRESPLAFIPAVLHLSIRDQAGGRPRSVRIFTEDRKGRSAEPLWSGIPDDQGVFPLAAPGPDSGGGGKGEHPVLALSRKGRGWLVIATETESGEEEAVLSLPEICLAFLKGAEKKAVLPVQTKKRP